MSDRIPVFIFIRDILTSANYKRYIYTIDFFLMETIIQVCVGENSIHFVNEKSKIRVIREMRKNDDRLIGQQIIQKLAAFVFIRQTLVIYVYNDCEWGLAKKPLVHILYASLSLSLDLWCLSKERKKGAIVARIAH